MSRFVVLLVTALFALLGLAATTAETPTSARKKTASARKKSAPAGTARSSRKSPAKPAAKTSVTRHRTSASSRKKSSSRSRARSSSKKRTTTARRSYRSGQHQPTPERYKEIQQALTDKGYFHGPVDGVWGAESVDALKRFQRDQNIADDGKIGSLSLIALGLGPKRTLHAQVRSQP